MDSKLTSFKKSNLLKPDNCIMTSQKINCFGSASTPTSVPQPSHPSHHPVNNEDSSFADSNISSYSSSEATTSSNISSSSSSSSSSIKKPTKLSINQPATTNGKPLVVLSSVSSSTSSSGVGSSNISSASSTTSETPSSEIHPQTQTPVKQPQQQQQHNHHRHSLALTGSSYKVAPKAVILDDGDIEIEIPTMRKSAFYKSPERETFPVERPKHSNRNSNLHILNHKQQQPVQQMNGYNLQQEYHQQNRLAAAAAAAAEVNNSFLLLL